MNKQQEEKIAKQHADAVENAGDMEVCLSPPLPPSLLTWS